MWIIHYDAICRLRALDSFTERRSLSPYTSCCAQLETFPNECPAVKGFPRHTPSFPSRCWAKSSQLITSASQDKYAGYHSTRGSFLALSFPGSSLELESSRTSKEPVIMPPTTISDLPDELLQIIFLEFSQFQLYHICLVSQRFSALANGPLYQKISTSSLSSEKFTALLVSLCLHRHLALHVRYLKLRLRGVSLSKPF